MTKKKACAVSGLGPLTAQLFKGKACAKWKK
jgi:hypothetical protein